MVQLRADNSTNPDVLFTCENEYASLLARVTAEENIISDALVALRERRSRVLADPYIACEQLCLDAVCALFEEKLRMRFGGMPQQPSRPPNESAAPAYHHDDKAASYERKDLI